MRRDTTSRQSGCVCSRRGVLKAGVVAAAAMGAQPFLTRGAAASRASISPKGPASSYTPKLRAAFVRREGEYGMAWPGQVFDGEAALKRYRAEVEQAARDFGMDLAVREKPIYSLEEGKAWVAQAEAAQADGLVLVVLDRQLHAWPTAAAAVESELPAVVFAPLGAAFTTNTVGLARKPKCMISCSNDFSQARRGLKMIAAGARLRETRYIVIAGDARKDDRLPHYGTRRRFVPAKEFLERYRAMGASPEIEALADDYLAQARSVLHARRQDVLNGMKSLSVAASLLEDERGDAITMDCLGAIGPTDISLPCIAWSSILDQGVPAACETDVSAMVTHALSQYLLGRPGFQQDPVPETVHGWLTGAHCTCPTKLNGYDAEAVPYVVQHHHGMRDATPVPMWAEGERVTVFDVWWDPRRPEAGTRMYISTGEVAGQNSAPPSGGCVVSVNLKLDGAPDLLTYPGFHQLFVMGDFRTELVEFCRLHGAEPIVV